MTFDRYTHQPDEPDPGSHRCQKCARFGFAYDKAIDAWRCHFCGYRDR